MYALTVLAVLSMCEGTSLIYQYEDIPTKSKIELSPVQITCNLNDIVILTFPVVNCNDVLYRLYRPNGDIVRLNFSRPKPKEFNTKSLDSYNDYDFYNYQQSKFVIKYINKDVITVYPKPMYRIINVDQSNNWRDDAINLEEKHKNENDFIIGPLLEEDHGNWVLSIYCKDIDGDWIEMFQVITIRVTSAVAMERPQVVLREGSTFNLSFKYPIKDLETCELTVPSRTPDRYFDRSKIELDKCGYVITNVTKKDDGFWSVIGVGRIVYEGLVRLHVVDRETSDAVISDLYENNYY